jgi:hypothetical protein
MDCKKETAMDKKVVIILPEGGEAESSTGPQVRARFPVVALS